MANAEGCWNCGNPLHHRLQCREQVSSEYAAHTKFEMRRLQEAMHPAPEPTFSIPRTMPIQLISYIVENAEDFYWDLNSRLDQVGRPGITEREARDVYDTHRNLSYKIHARRKTDLGFIPALKKVPKCSFSNEDEQLIFMGRVEYLSNLRSSVWEKTNRLLGWSKQAIALSKTFWTSHEILKAWIQANKNQLLGRPTRQTVDRLLLEAEPRQVSLMSMDMAWVEIRKICKVTEIQRLDNVIEIAKRKFEMFCRTLRTAKVEAEERDIQDAMNAARIEAEMERREHENETRRLVAKHEELKELVTCNICIQNQKEWLLPCGHLLCGECITLIILHEEDRPNRQICPACRGPIQPRRRIYF